MGQEEEQGTKEVRVNEGKGEGRVQCREREMGNGVVVGKGSRDCGAQGTKIVETGRRGHGSQHKIREAEVGGAHPTKSPLVTTLMP